MYLVGQCARTWRGGITGAKEVSFVGPFECHLMAVGTRKEV